MDEDELLDALREAVAKQRPYAGFFQWPEKPVAEWGIAETFCEAASSERGFPFRDLLSRPPGEDPPDCEALDSEGHSIAIEVTELVDGQMIAEVRRTKRNDFATWDASKICQQLDKRLTEKDAKSLKGGPYHEYLVLIHTDEPGLTFEAAVSALASHSFPNMTRVDRAYLLFSYDPQRSGYPYLKLYERAV